MLCDIHWDLQLEFSSRAAGEQDVIDMNRRLGSEAILRGDLQAIVRAFRALTYRGGIDADVERAADHETSEARVLSRCRGDCTRMGLGICK